MSMRPGSSLASERPSPRMPVPASITIRPPSSRRTSRQDVFPPYRTVSGPGAAKEPRQPHTLALTKGEVTTGPGSTRAGRPRERLLRTARIGPARSEEHTSELQSPCNLVCRLLLEKKKKKKNTNKHKKKKKKK